MHATSAIMSIATARAAGVPYVVACSPSYKQQGIPPLVLAAMSICQPDIVLTLGGVQAIAAMAFGLLNERPADVIVGPGNRFVAEAKRQLFGRVGIDMIAGPSESLIIADSTADPVIVAVDLMSQAEHGYDSPVWLVTDSRKLGEEVMDLVPRFIKTLPYPEVADQSWADYGQVILCSNREEMVQVSDTYAPEHLQVQAGDHEWWLEQLTNYGSLFLGEGSTVTYGDKAAGTNHILPTGQAARYTGGLSVGKFLKTVTYQSIPPVESFRIGAASSRLSRAEGMEGHARAADVRLQKYFPDYEFDFEIFNTSEYFARSG
jgi:sulfopropanediol 3-dehydrogenase